MSDDLIYILIGIAWLAYTIYRQQKKLRQKQQEKMIAEEQDELEVPGSEADVKGERSFIDDIFTEINRVSKPAGDYRMSVSEAGPGFEPEYTDQEADKALSAEKYYTKKEFVEANSPLTSEYFEEEKDEILTVGEEEIGAKSEVELEEEMEVEKFNLRRAVIYSEILNSPYF